MIGKFLVSAIYSEIMSISKNDSWDKQYSFLIEISKSSCVKLEHDGIKLHYDRMLDIAMPYNYGTFLEGRIQEDGDLLDVVYLSKEAVKPSTIIKTSQVDLLAVIEYYDGGQKDTKIICAPKMDYDKSSLNEKLYQITHYLAYLYHYKMKNNYVTNVYYSPMFGAHNMVFKLKYEGLSYQEKNLYPLLLNLLN